MDHYLTASETLLIFSISWAGPFILALVPQARILGRLHQGAPRAKRLVAVIAVEAALALAILIAVPLWQLPFFDLPGGFEILRQPLLAGVVAAVATTICLWFLYRAAHRDHRPGEAEAK